MKFQLLCFFILLFGIQLAFGQGIVRAKVVDENGESLIGVIVTLKSNNLVATNTDIDGNFTLRLLVPSPQIICLKFISYQPIEDTLYMKNGEVVDRKYIMKPLSTQLQDVTVVGRTKKSDDKYMESVKAKSVSTIDFISSATMRRVGDASVVAAVGRVAGVSSNGSFITVRGIGDRYVKTTINGLRIPTLDPFTNNIKLDMFPSSLIDNIVLTKTASADLPGDWAGAYLSVETKDYPDKLSVNVETQVGYNNQSTWKNVLSSQRSSTDWLGYDNGFRDYNHHSFSQANIDPSLYDEFVALGFGDYFKSMGVSSTEKWNQSSDSYYKLGLIELGLLDKASMNDGAAYKAAKTQFEKQYSNAAFDIINEKASESGQAFPNSWKSMKRKAPLNTSQSFSIGNKTIFCKRTLGYFIGFKYSNAIQYDPNSYQYKVTAINDKGKAVYDSLNQKVSKETSGWSGLFSLHYKFSKDHDVSLLFMPNITGVNNVKDITTNTYIQNNQIESTYSTSIFYEERKQMIYQLKTDHFFPAPQLKINVSVSYTKGESAAPDFKNSSFQLDSLGNKTNINGSNRYFRYLKENTIDNKIDCEMPLVKDSELSRKIKFGAMYQYNNRTSDQYSYYNRRSPLSIQLPNADPSSLDNYQITSILVDGIERHTMAMFYERLESPTNHSIGNSEIKAGYAMLDYATTQRLRFLGGLRTEHATIYTDVALYDSLHLSADDGRRQSSQTQINKPGKLNKTSILPSVACTYKLINDEKAPMNLKFNFSQTVARPSIRELSDVSVYDYELKKDVTGNPNLKMVQINNYDLRLEYYSKSGQNISLNVFYKDFKNHIELVDFDAFGYIWINNTKKSWLKGFEVEGKKTINKKIELRANMTVVNSQSTFIKSFMRNDGSFVIGDTVSRTMFGQAPYIFNGIVSYTSDSLNMTLSLSYNVQGSRLVITGSYGLPDVYERPRHMLDAKITKNFGKHFTLGCTIKDILNAAVTRSYKLNDNWIKNYDIYHYGTSYNVSLAYKL